MTSTAVEQPAEPGNAAPPEADPATEQPTAPPAPEGDPQSEPGPQPEPEQPGKPAEHDVDADGGAAAATVGPSSDVEPTPAQPILIECEKCGHMNRLLPDATVVPVPLSERFVVCGECMGLGKVATGSWVPSESTKPCPECAGKGWRDTRPDQPDRSADPLAPLAPAETDAPPWPGARWDSDASRWV